jgi:hypothetical protein
MAYLTPGNPLGKRALQSGTGFAFCQPMTTLKRFSLAVLLLTATWASGCSDAPAQTGTTPDSGSSLDVSSEPQLDAAPGDGATPDVADGSPCTAPGQKPVYDKPGCAGAAPAPVCRGVGDACGATYCGCDGVTLFEGCEGAKKPYAHAGPCADGGNAADGDATIYTDAPVCIGDAGLVYDRAGCGANTPARVCRGVGDACISTFCSCDGVTFLDACNWANQPFAHFGACPDGSWPDVGGGG